MPDENFLYVFKAARLRRPASRAGRPAGRAAALRPVPAGAAHALPATETERQTIEDQHAQDDDQGDMAQLV